MGVDSPFYFYYISQRGRQPGINHLGFQVDSDAALYAMRSNLEAADAGLVEQTGVACCYARSDKYWVTDPQGIAWETFHSLESVPMYGEDRRDAHARDAPACCIPLQEVSPSAADKACCA